MICIFQSATIAARDAAHFTTSVVIWSRVHGAAVRQFLATVFTMMIEMIV
jgi:hypothetical protein